MIAGEFCLLARETSWVIIEGFDKGGEREERGWPAMVSWDEIDGSRVGRGAIATAALLASSSPFIRLLWRVCKQPFGRGMWSPRSVGWFIESQP
jgi:hypothetical protein